jgi:hypothetical protein
MEVISQRAEKFLANNYTKINLIAYPERYLGKQYGKDRCIIFQVNEPGLH